MQGVAAQGGSGSHTFEAVAPCQLFHSRCANCGRHPHEANKVEQQIFSLGGRLSDPNMNPAYLATLVFIGSNYKVCMPPKSDIWQRYLRKFSKGGKRSRGGARPGVYFSFNLGGWRLRTLMLELNADWCLLLHSDWGCLSEDAVQGGWSWAVRMGLQSVTRTGAEQIYSDGIHEYHE